MTLSHYYDAVFEIASLRNEKQCGNMMNFLNTQRNTCLKNSHKTSSALLVLKNTFFQDYKIPMDIITEYFPRSDALSYMRELYLNGRHLFIYVLSLFRPLLHRIETRVLCPCSKSLSSILFDSTTFPLPFSFPPFFFPALAHICRCL